MENIETQGLEYRKVEELLEDRNANVFDPFLLNGPIKAMKQKLNFLRDQGTNLHNIYQSFFHLFATEKNLWFPKICGMVCKQLFSVRKIHNEPQPLHHSVSC